MKRIHVIIQYTPYVFIASLLSGQLIRIPFLHGVIYPHDIFLGVCLILGFFFVQEKKQMYIPQPIQRGFQFFIAFLFLSICIQAVWQNSTMSLVGFSYGIRFLYYIIGSFYLVAIYPKLAWGKALYLDGTVFAIIGISQFILYPDLRNLMYLGWDPHYYRLFSTLLDPNFAGIIIVLTFILGVSGLSAIRNTKISIVLQLINIAALLLTLSRSSYIAAFGAICMFIVFTKKWKWLLGVVGVLLGALFLKTPGGSVFSELRQVSGMARIENWKESISLIMSSLIYGHGFYMLKSMGIGSTRAFGYLDNSFLFVFASAGIGGFITFIYVYFQLLKYAYIRMATNLYARGLFLSLIAVGIHSQFVNSLFYPWVLLWIGILIANDYLRVKS